MYESGWLIHTCNESNCHAHSNHIWMVILLIMSAAFHYMIVLSRKILLVQLMKLRHQTCYCGIITFAGYRLHSICFYIWLYIGFITKILSQLILSLGNRVSVGKAVVIPRLVVWLLVPPIPCLIKVCQSQSKSPWTTHWIPNSSRFKCGCLSTRICSIIIIPTGLRFLI